MRAPHCPVDRVAFGDPDRACEGVASYYCDELACGPELRRRARGETTMAEQLAERFHEAYERLAPSYGYATRPDSAVPWARVPERNRRLMVAAVEGALNDNSDHVLELRDDGWTLQHPLRCRLASSLFDCHTNNVVQDQMADSPPPSERGRFVVTVDSDDEGRDFAELGDEVPA